MCFLLIKLYFQEPVHQQCGIADQELCFNPFRESVVYRTGIKACLHDPKAVFNLISFMGYGEYVFCRVRKILKTRNENLIITIIRHIIDVSPDFAYNR